MFIRFDDLRAGYKQLWDTMTVRAEWTSEIERAAQGVLRSKAEYRTVEAMTGVPWFVVGLIHSMESGGDFKTHLHNGDPLSARTCNIPAGRPSTGSPPFIWSETAADAVRYSKLDQVSEWSCEGKFVLDNVWDPNAVSKQVGCMPIFHRLMTLDPFIGRALRTQRIATSVSGGQTQEGLDVKELQERLSKIPFYQDTIDGIYGQNTRAAIQAILVTQRISDWNRWTGDRLLVAGKQVLCQLDGIEVGEIDGIEGPQTQYALSVYAARKRGDKSVETWRDAEEAAPGSASCKGIGVAAAA
jgi:lysozyme family protein